MRRGHFRRVVGPFFVTFAIASISNRHYRFLTSLLNCTIRNFDKSLQSRNPDWGVRDLEEVCKAASEQGLVLVEKIEMPANNLSLIFRKKKEK